MTQVAFAACPDPHDRADTEVCPNNGENNMATVIVVAALGLVLVAALGHALRVIAYALNPQRVTEERLDEFVSR